MEVLIFLGIISLIFVVLAYAVGHSLAGWILAPLEEDDD